MIQDSKTVSTQAHVAHAGHGITTMNVEHIEIRRGGKSIRVPSVCINGRTVVVTGKRIKTAAVMDEELFDGETVPDPETFIPRLKKSGLKADIFTFAQKLPDLTRKFNYSIVWDNAAIVPTTSYSEWFEKRAEYGQRKAIRRSAKLGVVTKLSEFNDAFVEGISGIYNESSVRQGTKFWHYQKDLAAVKLENATYLDRSDFIGAYFNDELIGFIKMVYVGNISVMLQIISQKKHLDKKPTVALLAKAIEICAEKGMSYLTYGKFVYNDPNSSLTEFKRRIGFEQALIPRYYVPLTQKGKVALALKLHRPLVERVPKPMLAEYRRLRGLWHNRKNAAAAPKEK